MNPLKFPDGFLWGTATSSHQVEGNNVLNDWWEWEQHPSHIQDSTTSSNACEWWNGRAEQDLEQAAQLGQNAHRLSIEWSRLEPQQGQYNEKAFQRYYRLFSKMHELGITPMVTLYHFTLPKWVADAGGWINPHIIDWFGQFAFQCGKRFGKLVPLWCTINEPIVLVYMAYTGTKWPPGLGSMRQGLKAARNLLLAHSIAYHILHNIHQESQVGIVLNMPFFMPARPNSILDVWISQLHDWFANGLLLHSLSLGKLGFPLSFTEKYVSSLDNAWDFIGLNYYGSYEVQFDPRAKNNLWGRYVQEPSRKTSTNDWGKIAPHGLTAQLLRLAHFKKPIYVTENGVYDNQDTIRPHYLLEHIYAVYQALQQGTDVRGYFHWSLIDNFEWTQGWSTHFGLIAVDPSTQKRRIKTSAYIYAKVCQTNSLPSLNPEYYLRDHQIQESLSENIEV